jgi:AcrR family transcriptional regulator
VPAATKFTSDDLLDAALEAIAEAGVDGVSMAEVGRRLGAPNGSIYHRFPTRKHLLGALWARTAAAYRESLEGALAAPDRDEIAAAVVDHTFSWIADNPARAELLLRLRTEDFVPADWPPEILEQVDATNRALAESVLALASRLDVDPLDVTLAVIDIPAALARRSILLADPKSTAHLVARATQLSRELLR